MTGTLVERVRQAPPTERGKLSVDRPGRLTRLYESAERPTAAPEGFAEFRCGRPFLWSPTGASDALGGIGSA